MFIQRGDETAGRPFDVLLRDIMSDSWHITCWQELNWSTVTNYCIQVLVYPLNTAERKNRMHYYLWHIRALLHSIIILMSLLIAFREPSTCVFTTRCLSSSFRVSVVLEISCCICLQLLPTPAPLKPVVQYKPQSWPMYFHSRNRTETTDQFETSASWYRS